MSGMLEVLIPRSYLNTIASHAGAKQHERGNPARCRRRREKGPMSGGFHIIDILLAAIAVFILYRLFRVLGRRTGHEGEHTDILTRERRMGQARTGDKVVPLPKRDESAGASQPAPRPQEAERGAADEAPGGAEPKPARRGGQRVGAGLTQIALADQSFDEAAFLSGARAAFEIIMGAYARGDTGELRGLLASDVYDEFLSAIRQRDVNKERLEFNLAGLPSAQIVDAELIGKTAQVTVKFVSEQISTLRDKLGAVIEGEPDTIVRVTDYWTFERDTRSRDPNWKLAATQASQ
jgi:predicted lipid-binding transport protein (Tim44 family)